MPIMAGRKYRLVIGYLVTLVTMAASDPGEVRRRDDYSSCYVTQLNGCRYKVTLIPVDDACPYRQPPLHHNSPAMDDPEAGRNRYLDRRRDDLDGDSDVGTEAVDAGGGSDLDQVSLKKIENLEQTLIRMMEGLSTRSLRHIRQIKTDLRQMSQSMNQLKAKTAAAAAAVSSGTGGGSGRAKLNEATQCPPEFVGGGTWPSCYRLALFNASWHEARDYCTAFGANLLSLDTIKEAYIIDYVIKSNPGENRLFL